jgi:hypothetical protein
MYNKKVLSEATKNLDRTVAPAQKKDIITDPMGQWKYPGKDTRIPGNDITMQGVPYPVWAQPNVGPGIMMQPNNNYQFPNADYVDEFPMAAYGGDISIPDLSQYEDGGEYDLTDDEIAELKKGGYVVEHLPSLPKKKGSKAYSRSLTATNRLFAQNPLLKKPKSKKNKIFDPQAKQFEKGGFQDDLGKHRQLLRDWTYGQSIGMLQKAQIGLIKSPYQLPAGTMHPMQMPAKKVIKQPTRTYDPLLDYKPQVSESTKPKTVATIDKNLLKKEVVKKTEERKKVAEVVKKSPILTDKQKTEILMSPQKLDENIYLAYQKEPETLKAAKEYSTADKATNILRNPLVAASYFMKPGEFNMPMNYSELERSPNYSDETWNRNAVGQGINFASYFTPVGLALHTADNALYTASDLDKALESGKIEDWKQAGLSAANTGLDLIGLRYIGNSGRLLNTGERATLNAMNTSNRLGLNSGVNNYLSTRVFPNISSQVVRSADNLPITRLFPQINPSAATYNPLSRNLYNQAVTAGNVQNASQAVSESLPAATSNFESAIDWSNWNPQTFPGIPSNQFVRSGLGGMDMSRYEIKNPDYFTQLLNTYDSKALSSSNKKFYKDLIDTVKKQEGLVTERQYNELQRLKTGNFNFGKKAYDEGGYIEVELTPQQIKEYRDGGYIVDELD